MIGETCWGNVLGKCTGIQHNTLENSVKVVLTRASKTDKVKFHIMSLCNTLPRCHVKAELTHRK